MSLKKMSLKKGHPILNVTQIGILLKWECQSNWNGTQNGMAQQLECH